MKRISIVYVCVRDKSSDHAHFKSVSNVGHRRVKKKCSSFRIHGCKNCVLSFLVNMSPSLKEGDVAIRQYIFN